MSTTSVWTGTAGAASRPALPADTAAEVVVVGGGITGVTTAFLLAAEHRPVILLEAHGLGAGDTGGSTGNIYETLSGGLLPVREKWGPQVARAVVASRRDALEFIERQATRLDAASFRPCDLWIYAGSPDADQSVGQEHDAVREAGVQGELADDLPPGPPRAQGRILRIPGQAQIHPLAYVQALANEAERAGARIFENSPVVEVDASAGMVRTESGAVRARHIVLATHSPSGMHGIQFGMLARREYGVAYELTGPWPAGTFWTQGQQRLSLRSLEWDSRRYLIAVGQQGATGKHHPQALLEQLEAIVERRLGYTGPAFHWSAQHFHSPDHLPYIGRDASGCFIASGFQTDGLTFGTVAARMISDDITGRLNPWSELYRPTRTDLLRSASGIVEVTKGAAKALGRDLVHKPQATLDGLSPGQGAIVEHQGRSVAAFRSESGDVFAVSPVCTHMKCHVRWNGLERSWDCPCHGSRFAPDGSVIEGPALQPLERVQT